MSAVAQTTRRAEDPADDVRMARLHLRMGQLTLARAELEDLLGRDALDTGGLAALAEVRWRTGDSQAAAAAAEAHLEAGGLEPVAVCIAAEAAAADGRHGDARVLMERLPGADAAMLDALFAGMPRRAFWPAAPVDRTDLEEIRREPEARAAGPRAGAPGRDRPAESPTSAERLESRTNVRREGVARSVPGPRDVLEAAGTWSDVAAEIAGAAGAARARGVLRASDRGVRPQLDPRAEVAVAREELGTKPERAFLRLALVLRRDPTLAPDVLDAVHLRSEPAAAMLRGDAQRLLGRHLEAEAEFDGLADSLDAT